MYCPLCDVTMNKEGRFTYTCPICGYSEYDEGDDDEEE